MVETSENTLGVILQKDPVLPKDMDFDTLRKKGLVHIGNLAGKIWTDHNVHDPGITILEVLIYALMDLGYRTNLPLEDLITPKNPTGKDDNFFTPLEILSVNPVSITDYRKLLLEVNGVRNAWLEPMEQEMPIFIDKTDNLLCCGRPPEPHPKTADPNFNEGLVALRREEKQCEPGREFLSLHLNGLYKIYIEVDPDLIRNKKQQDDLEMEVRELLNQYRNLCEDFAKIYLLAPSEIGVCTEVEMHPGYVPEKVYAQIVLAIKRYIQPEIKYYTLTELLDQGKAIEDIFAGRPYRAESFGFVDTRELETLERRTALHISDLYQVVLNIEGVRKINAIHFVKDASDSGSAPPWSKEITIEEGTVPVFSMEKTCVDIYGSQGAITLNKSKVHQGFSFLKKFLLPADNLDLKIPLGQYREGLEDYYSIQNDFPVVYGIGENRLPDNATLLRETQALQLKGFLLFFDQMLANYTAQLSHIRSLFSLKREKNRTTGEKQTYFTSIPQSVPDLGKLLKFYDKKTVPDAGTRLAVPVANNGTWKLAVEALGNDPRTPLTIADCCGKNGEMLSVFSFSSVEVRSIYITQLKDTYINENYSIKILRDRYGCFFVLIPQIPADLLLVGVKRYKTALEASNDAKNIAFIATLKESYSLVTEISDTAAPDKHCFDIRFRAISYQGLIQEITENTDEYAIRRKQFLDHLLARFGEEFTDYIILQYQNKSNVNGSEFRAIEDESYYLSEFDELSRDRGKAFNYSMASWNSQNVSGFEKRVARLSGIPDYKRRNLCNFEVYPCFRLLLKNPDGITLFRDNRSYETPEELFDAAGKVLKQLREPEGEDYRRLEKRLSAFEPISIQWLFSKQPADDNIVVTKYNYFQKLDDLDGKEVVKSRNVKMRSGKTAGDKKDDFIRKINDQAFANPDSAIGKLRLIPLEKENRFLNVNALQSEITIRKSYKWYIMDKASNSELSSNTSYPNTEVAWEALVKEVDISPYISKHPIGIKWTLTTADGITFTSLDQFPDNSRALAAWRQAKMLGSDSGNFKVVDVNGGRAIQLNNEQGVPIAGASALRPGAEAASTIKRSASVFSKRTTKPEYLKEAGKFGFRITGESEDPILVSYPVFNSEKEALQHMAKVFELGKSKKNYLQSGDQGNPQYNFILISKDTFLAMPPEVFETASDRHRALNAVLKLVKKTTLPAYVKEEPKRYGWSLNEGDLVLNSDMEFRSRANAQADLDKKVSLEVSVSIRDLFSEHIYEFKSDKTPAEFNFVYGVANAQKELEPIFMGPESFDSEKGAMGAYSNLIKKFPGLNLKTNKKKEQPYEFALYDGEGTSPLAVQYRSGTLKASLAKAESVTFYIQNIYTKEGSPRESFIKESMAENREGRYEWRFYKKNAPIARSPYCCHQREMAARIKNNICDSIPQVSLTDCPPKVIVVCPEKDPKLYHYQVCFRDDKGHEFVLISYLGYNSHQHALEAWNTQWIDIIELARYSESYGGGGKISLDEVYGKADSNACDERSFLVVIPENHKKLIKENGLAGSVVDYYMNLANLFPIFRVADAQNKTCHTKYKYRVVDLKNSVGPTDCTLPNNTIKIGTLLWESIDCYDTVEEAIKQYHRFYTLAGVSNNCRIFCEKGCFYVGMVEVLVESNCEFESETEAWDDAFPKTMDRCGDCVPGGLREFLYAAEDPKNYVVVSPGAYCTFKVVSPRYFVVDHNCSYNSSEERNLEMKKWISQLEKTDWKEYITNQSFKGSMNSTALRFLKPLTVVKASRDPYLNNICTLAQGIRECLGECHKIAADSIAEYNEKRFELVKTCLLEKFRNNAILKNHLEDKEVTLGTLEKIANYFPVYKTDRGYCFRLYWPNNDLLISEEGLQPCGCEEDKEEATGCREAYPFISSNCYSCCEEAIKAFLDFCALMISGAYTLEGTSKSDCGPYAFRIVDYSRTLGYHPQQYSCIQEVYDAIGITRKCVDNTGLHLLEHILLRPKNELECVEPMVPDLNIRRVRESCCLLPICPDYCCDISFYPDMEKDDPCIDINPEVISYLPGSDPYSFWATLVMPAWDSHFRSAEARQAFEKFLYKEVPALVGLHILWLSPRNLCKFEDAYKNWLEWVEVPEALPCDPTLSSPNCEMVKCIRMLQSEDACESVPGSGGTCDCKKAPAERPDACCLPPDTTGTIFWGYCPPEPAQVPSPNEDPAVLLLKKTVAKKNKKAAAASKEKKDAEKATLALVRKRNPGYLANIEALADDNMKRTKSYERGLFYLQNAASLPGYIQLVNYFNRYSLRKDAHIGGYLELLNNATWHLFDTLVLEKKAALNKEEMSGLKKSLKLLSKKGMVLEETAIHWQSAVLAPLANTKVMKQLKEILK